METETIVLKIMRLKGADPNIALPCYKTSGAVGADVRANFLRVEGGCAIQVCR